MTDHGTGGSSAKKIAAVVEFSTRVEDACRGVGEAVAGFRPGDGGPSLKELVDAAGSADRVRMPAALERLRHGGDPRAVFASTSVTKDVPGLDPALREWSEHLIRLKHCRAEALDRFRAAGDAARVLIDPWFDADLAFLATLVAAVDARRTDVG